MVEQQNLSYKKYNTCLTQYTTPAHVYLNDTKS